MVLTAILAVLLTAGLIVPVLYNVHENDMSRELKQEAGFIVSALELATDDVNYLEKLDAESRITLISADGTVLFDSVANAALMENHAERPEVNQALKNGGKDNVTVMCLCVGKEKKGSFRLQLDTILMSLLAGGALLLLADLLYRMF